MTGKQAILFVGHGSRDAAGNDEVREFVRAVAAQLSVAVVETCFLEFEEPTIRQGIRRCVELGAAEVAVVPITLFSAGHAKLHIPAEIDEARIQYSGVRFTYGRPIGVHDQVLDILESRLEEAGVTRDTLGETAVLVVGRGSSDADANSDLFKISRLLWERTQVGWVETAFIGVTSPSLEEGLERCMRLGAKRVAVLPYFLFTGVLMKRMEEAIARFAAAHPERSFVLAEYFGFHPRLRQILAERAGEALGDAVKLNCDMCQYRIEAAKEMAHHHEHGHEHEHEHEHGHGDEQAHNHAKKHNQVSTSA